jgi:hypothetical protein
MTTTKKFLTQAFAVQTDEAQDVPGLAFTIPAGQPAHLKLQLLYDCPPDVDGVLSLDLNALDLEYAGFVLDGIHRVNSAPDPQPDNPLAINFEMANVVGLTDIELPGRGIAFRRDLLSVDYFFIGGDNDVKFNVCFRQKAPGTAPSTIRWAKAEFNAG